MLPPDQKELSLTMLGKLAALIEWLSPQHREVAELLERGETKLALDRLHKIISEWHAIAAAYTNLAKMLHITLAELPVHDLNGELVLNEFCRHFEEIQTALRNQDFVLLADILQYEFDAAITNWMSLLESTLGVVEPVSA
jgi:hypothetical protein